MDARTQPGYVTHLEQAKDWTCSLKPPQRILDLIFQLNTSATSTKEQVIQPHPNIISVVQHFSEITVSSFKDSRILRLLAKYNKLIFCAICHVACCAGASKQNVDSAMKRLSNSHSSYLDQLRQGAAWQLEAINKLHENSEWGLRSSDILFDFPPAFESMRRWGKSQESMKTFVDTLNDRSYVEGMEHSAGMALSVPCILKCIFGKVLRWAQLIICEHASQSRVPSFFGSNRRNGQDVSKFTGQSAVSRLSTSAKHCKHAVQCPVPYPFTSRIAAARYAEQAISANQLIGGPS
ncbi:hypothetical protein BO79DRAFT_220445 [Aspergillus costaricaensis CBS 115574]|uniref:Uncharacterized protein n=1 Tax=Aspergillus costaricaensis CBS 115574 TaxID=1448317 RepID=A0ACD1I7U9_9EURO|nr:hypothetical protein BO79DRAFT_220445 [Aspergillus costaricaensis CBS 115574]RAK85825.1 hypothetical protein BO79DRAFT_220445 [Aspergillus costaricaensis CBS 115574]